MSNTLLNTVGSRSTNFQLPNYKQPVTVNPTDRIKQLPSGTTGAENKTSGRGGKNDKLVLALGCLAVIGAGSYILYDIRKRGGKGLRSEDSPLMQMKTKARNEYHKLKENVLAEFNENLPEELKVREGVTFNSSKELEEFKDALKTGDDFSIEKYERIRDNSSSIVKNKLAELQGDKEWIELRKLRKFLLKQAEAKDDKGAIAREKISIINDLMSFKVDTSREQVFKNRNMMDVNDAFGLIRRDFGSLDEFNTAKNEVTKYDFDFDLGEGFFAGHKKLKVDDLFEEEHETFNFARDNLNKIRNIFENVIPKAKEDLHKKLNELALNFRTSEFMQNVYNFTRESA